MKLNKKGWSKAERYLCPECWKDTNWERPKEPEFEAEDFKPEVQIKPKEPEIRLSIEEAEYALKCIRYLASGFDFELSDFDTQNMWNFADVIYRRVEKVK